MYWWICDVICIIPFCKNFICKKQAFSSKLPNSQCYVNSTNHRVPRYEGRTIFRIALAKHISKLYERYKSQSSSLWSVLHSPFSSLLGLNIHRRILFSNTFSLCCFLKVSDHVSQPHCTMGMIITTGMIILIFRFLDRSGKDKRVWTE